MKIDNMTLKKKPASYVLIGRLYRRKKSHLIFVHLDHVSQLYQLKRNSGVSIRSRITFSNCHQPGFSSSDCSLPKTRKAKQINAIGNTSKTKIISQSVTSSNEDEDDFKNE